MGNHNYKIIKMCKLKVSFNKSWWTRQMKSQGKTDLGKRGAFILHSIIRTKVFAES
jgi:hypothetical protein